MRKHFSFAFVPFFCFCNSTFFHSGYVIKDPLTRYAPTELHLLQATQIFTEPSVYLLCGVSQVLWQVNESSMQG